MEFTLIIFRLLRRLAPLQAAAWAVSVCLDWGTRVFEIEEYRGWLEQEPKNAQWFGGWLAVAEGWLDALICIAAHRRLKRPCRVLLPRHEPVPAVRTAEEGYRRLVLLYLRFEDRARLIRLRAIKLRRLYDSTDPLGRTRSVVEATSPCNAKMLPPPRSGGGVERRSRETAGARIRGPPGPTRFRRSRQSQPAIGGNADACPH